MTCSILQAFLSAIVFSMFKILVKNEKRILCFLDIFSASSIPFWVILTPFLPSYIIKSSHGGNVTSDELGLKMSSNNLVLPCGYTTRWYK